MAVAFDAVSESAEISGVQTSVSTTHTAAGTDRYAVATLCYRADAGAPGNITATYDGTAMTSRINFRTGVSGVIIFTLANPSTTTNATVTFSFDSTDFNGARMYTRTYTGVAGGVGNTQTDGSTSAQTTSITLTSIGADDFGVDGFASSGGNAANDPTVGANQTIRGTRVSNPGFKCGSSDQDGVNGGTMTWDNIETDQVNQAGVVLLAAASGEQFRAYSFAV